MKKPAEVVFITGLSGSGKSTALDALEDAGFFPIDNLPLDLLKKLIELAEYADINRIAITCDIRDIKVKEKLTGALKWLKENGLKSTVLFLYAKKSAIITRYEQTRRNHPLSVLKKIPLSEAIDEEMQRIEPLKEFADIQIDTTNLSPTELRRFIFSHFSKSGRLVINLISFGFKYGIPIESDNVFDIRFIPNPYFIEELKHTTGLDEKTYNFVMEQAETKSFLKIAKSALKQLIPLYEKEGKSYLTISIGCSGGKHRSVAIVEYLKEYINQLGFHVEVLHRDIER